MTTSYFTEMAAFEHAKEMVENPGSALFRQPLKHEDLSELAAKLTAQEATLALRTIAKSSARIEEIIGEILKALTDRFGSPMKTADLRERHANMDKFRADPEYIGTVAIHERLLETLSQDLSCLTVCFPTSATPRTYPDPHTAQ